MELSRSARPLASCLILFATMRKKFRLSSLQSEIKNLVLPFAFIISALSTAGQVPRQDELLSIVEVELKREMAELSKASQPPYYLSYRIHDTHSAYINSSFGSLVGADSDHSRILVTDIKVGDYSFDSSHPVNNLEDFDMYDAYGSGGATELPLDNASHAIKFTLWQQTQNSYRQALNMYKALRSQPPQELKPVGDFSREKTSVFVAPPLEDFKSFFHSADWRERIKKFSAPFANHPDVIDGTASLEVNTERKYFISSEGTTVVQNRTYAYISIRGSIRADDGDPAVASNLFG